MGCLISLVHTKQKLEQLEAVRFLTLSRVYHLATVMFPATFKSTSEMKNCDFIHSSLEWILAGHYRLLWSTSDSQVNCLLFYSILSRMNKHPSCLHSLHRKPGVSGLCVPIYILYALISKYADKWHIVTNRTYIALALSNIFTFIERIMQDELMILYH